MPLFWRRTEALSSCASILEEKGALTRSSSLYFRGEGRSYCLYFKAERNLWTILEENETFKQSYCLYFRGEGSRQTELLPLFSSRTESLSRRPE